MDVTARVPVVVVGGGIAGLAAAHRLVETLGPDAMLLLEGEPRLGGKITTERVDGFVIEGGPDRVSPPCPHYSACGGCQLMHVTLSGQRAAKVGQLSQALARIGQLDHARHLVQSQQYDRSLAQPRPRPWNVWQCALEGRGSRSRVRRFGRGRARV